MRKIAFYFRLGIVAKGDFAHTKRVVEYMIEHYPSIYEYYFIHYSDLSLRAELEKLNVTFIDEQSSYGLLEDAIIIVPFNQLLFLADDLKDIKNAKICVSFMHPSIITWFVSQLRGTHTDCHCILEQIHAAEAYVFMDDVNRIITNDYCQLEFAKRYFPVCSSPKTSDHSRNFVSSALCSPDSLNIGWMGRLDYDKINSVINVLENLNDICSTRHINFHIIGDGNSKSMINLSRYTPNIRIYFNSFLTGFERDHYLQTNLDLVFAVGLSALDVAMLEIPTVIPLSSNSKIRQDRYVYLYDTSGYSLGCDGAILKQLGCQFHSMSEIINGLFIQDAKVECARKCYETSAHIFSAKNSAENLLSSLFFCNLTIAQLLSNKAMKRNLHAFKIYKYITGNKDILTYLNWQNKKYTLIRKIKTLSKKELIKSVLKKMLCFI